ncbi:MAG: hypothetical protein DSZ10_03625 [Sulfurovum sp.]|nr:MAG: hypothetical protein DSZ10_03625 [Sulfurovum sp.]
MKSKSWNKYLPMALFAAFIFASLVAFFQGKPASKNARVYKTVQQYSPYYLDKRFGGLTIKSKTDETFQEKPTNLSIFHEFERLEKEWGKKHLKMEANTLLIFDDNHTIQAKLPIKTAKELDFIHHYYGI